MVKIGPAFNDAVSSQKIDRRRNFGSFVSSEVLYIFPLFLLALVLSVIVARLFYVQILKGSYYKTLADTNRTRTKLIPAPRGIILDRRGRPLVANSATFKITENGVSKPLDESTALKMISQNKNVESQVGRNYLYKSVFAHVLGYVGKISENEVAMPKFSNYGLNEFVGKAGLESEYENLLHGENGRQLYEVDSRGKYMRALGQKEPIPGQDIRTTLDLDIQKSAADATSKVEKGAVVVSDPRDGAILTLYSKPNFDPNVFVRSSTSYTPEGDYKTPESILLDRDNQPLLDRAIAGSYPPGSTFKLIAATAALERGSITPTTQIEDTGILKVGAFSFGNWYFLQYGRTEGSLNIVGAIKRSNDIFFYKTAEMTGIDHVSEWARKFGLGSKLGLDLPAETTGTVPTVEWKQKVIGEQWYLGDTYNYGIGQGYLLTTPLQVNMFTTVFANKGTLFRPHLLQGQIKVLKKDFIKSQTMDLVRTGMMEACDTGGVAWPLFQFKVKNPRLPIDNRDYFKTASDSADMVHVKIACKTGTAEVGGDKNPDAWITVFAPFYKPEIAVTVLVENGGEGSSIAGPIAKKILTDYFEHK
jgi:penicillin-binding protein 2